jgi:hypothetical protein
VRGCDSVGFGCRVRRSGGNCVDPRMVWTELMRFSVFGCAISLPVPCSGWINTRALHDPRVEDLGSREFMFFS